MTNITARTSKTVKIAAPEWFREPEFQAWYNTRLGRDLATWQDANQPLSNDVRLSASECRTHSDTLLGDVCNADIFYEPSKTFSDDYEGECQKMTEIDNQLSSLTRTLDKGADGDGVGINDIRSMSQTLNAIVQADPFFEPEYDTERYACEQAENALEALDAALTTRIHRAAALSGDSMPDVFVTVEPDSPEGIHSDLPERYWDIVVREAHKVADGTEDCQIVVWISPL